MIYIKKVTYSKVHAAKLKMGISDRESRYEKTGVYMLIICQT